MQDMRRLIGGQSKLKIEYILSWRNVWHNSCCRAAIYVLCP